MPHPTVVLNVVGLTRSLLGEHAPHLTRHAAQGQVVHLEPALPAVTCTVQASMLTGARPREHGIVANGWYFRDLAEVRFWNRSNRLIQGEQVWQTARHRDASVTCANLFWWHNAHADVDTLLNVRPIYKANGRKLPDCYSEPASVGVELQAKLGTFPLFHFWGPAADIRSSRWIAQAAMHVHRTRRPTLSLVYLPHLDYALQKLGPDHAGIAQAVAEIDAVVGELLAFYTAQNVRVLIVSEYGIEPVRQAIAVNRTLREAGALYVREEQGLEVMEPGASRAFAVTDHQVAHVYVRNAEDMAHFASVCGALPGVERVLDRAAQRAAGIDHARSGELVLVAARGCWFTYDYWLDDAKAPDFARTVDIHRKPGFDPRELFLDPRIRLPHAAIGWRLFKSKLLNVRTLMDVIPLDTSLVRGSHGRTDMPRELQPLLILPGGPGDADVPERLPCEAVRDVMLSALFDEVVRVGGTSDV